MEQTGLSLGGVLGFEDPTTADPDAFTIAEERGIAYEFIADEKTATVHPNTADILLEDPEGIHIAGSRRSIGGGKMQIVRINQIEVAFTGKYSTLICAQRDVPGVITHISSCLSAYNVNIAFMRLFREKKERQRIP